MSTAEEPVFSKKAKHQANLKDFRKYLVDKEVVLAIVKCKNKNTHTHT